MKRTVHQNREKLATSRSLPERMSDSMDILCLCPNRQNVENILPITDSLKTMARARVDFLKMDGFFAQDTESLLEGQNIVKLPIMLPQSFYFMGELEKLKYLRRIRKIIAFDKRYDVVLLGGMGIIEFHITRLLKRRFGTKIFLIQDAISLTPEGRSLKKRLRSIFYGFQIRHNLCTRIFVSGEATKRTLKSDEVHEHLIMVTGIPRFSYLFDQKLDNTCRPTSDVLKILYLTAAYEWHGFSSRETEIQNETIQVLERMSESDCQDVAITVRLHPRLKLKVTSEKVTVEDGLMTPIFKSIQQSDTVLSSTYPSTALFEALWFGKQAVVVREDDDYGTILDGKRLEQAIPIIPFAAFKENPIKVIRDFHHVIEPHLKEYYISAKSEESVKIICHQILIDLQNDCL